jgi:hypothetical protein
MYVCMYVCMYVRKTRDNYLLFQEEDKEEE